MYRRLLYAEISNPTKNDPKVIMIITHVFDTKNILMIVLVGVSSSFVVHSKSLSFYGGGWKIMKKGEVFYDGTCGKKLYKTYTMIDSYSSNSI